MLRSIDQVTGLGVFAAYRKATNLPDFERFNVIYGLNGSGKTTLSRLFANLETGGSNLAPDVQYQITIDGDESIKRGDKYLTKVRVFNVDFVQANLGELEDRIEPIFILGKENKELAEQVATDKKELITRSSQLQIRNKEKSQTEKSRGDIFTQIAKTIAADRSGQATRNYRKPQAEKAFNELTETKTLCNEEYDAAKATLKQSALPKLPIVSFSELDFSKMLSDIEAKIEVLCNDTAAATSIFRLRENPDISKWVEEGHSIHNIHSSTACEYCGQSIPQERVTALAAHFSESDQQFKKALEMQLQQIDILSERCSRIELPQTLALYDELREEFTQLTTQLNDRLSVLTEHLANLKNILENKLKRRTESYQAKIDRYDCKPIGDDLEAIGVIVNRHNAKSDKFEAAVQDAQKKLEHHHLSGIKADVDAKDAKITALKMNIDRLQNGDPETGELGIHQLSLRISSVRENISSSHRAAGELTNRLQTFLGRAELRFEPYEEGYRVFRHDQPATRLSEGEQTAIAFVYFTVQLQDRDFDTNNGIVVIDDPVSSLDSNSSYQAFAFMKEAVKSAQQVFLLTHNFDFLKLILNWFGNIKNSEGKKSYFMIQCDTLDEKIRKSKLFELDKELRNSNSEYGYLFKTLYQFQSDGSISQSYNIPNIARKLLESFLYFHFHGTGSLYHKLDKVKFDTHKKDAISKFSNDLSHPTGRWFDHALVPETQKAVKYLLEMIKDVAPIHYKTLVDSIDADKDS